MKSVWPPTPGGKALVVAPLAVVAFYGTMLSFSATRDTVRGMLAENRHVELVTFVSLLVGSVLAGTLAWRSRRRFFTLLFYTLFALGLLVTAMEEVAWGQTLFGFETPRFLWGGLNRQHELTLHNIEGLHGRTELLRMAFGAGGLVGVWLWRYPRFRSIAAPPVLWTWFLLIAVLAGLDLINDSYRIHRRFDKNVHELSEVVEMMVGLAGMLYAWIKLRETKKGDIPLFR